MSDTLAVCRIGACDLHAEFDVNSGCVTQLLHGEACCVKERRDKRARVCLKADGYTGWIDQSALAMSSEFDAGHRIEAPPPVLDFSGAAGNSRDNSKKEHHVSVRSTLLFANADLKSRVLLQLPLNAQVLIDGEDDGPFAPVKLHDDALLSLETPANPQRPTHAWVWRRHCLPNNRFLTGSLVETARRLYTGAPYRWGGRTPTGADCSGLVHGTAAAHGIALPRDSKPQEDAIDTRVDVDDRDASDLVFWPGHVAILIDREAVFHATAHHLSAVDEPLRDVIARAGAPTSIRRLTQAADMPMESSASS